MILYPFARIFNPDMIIIPISLISIIGYFLKIFENIKKSIIYGTFYGFFCIPICLIVTLALKKIFGRKRPIFDEKLKNKPIFFRSNEKNCSFPSGDSL